MNFDIPVLRRRAQIEIHKTEGLTDKISEAVERTADDASSRLSGVRLPQIDIGGAVESARRTVDHALRAAGEGGDAIVHGAEKAAARASHMGSDLGTAVDDLRHLRVSVERPQRDPWPGVALVMGVVGGVVAMFLFDPRDGRRRRTVLRDKLGKWSRQASRELRGSAVDLRNRSQGVIHEAKSALGFSGQADEPEWADRSEHPLGSQNPAPWERPHDQSEPQAVAVAVGGSGATGATVGDYSDITHEPGQTNGYESNS